MLCLLLSFAGCATYQPPPPGVPRAELSFRLSSRVGGARLRGGVCDDNERCLTAGAVKLRSSPIISIRASQIVTVYAHVGTPAATCPTFFLSFKPEEGHRYELRTLYGFHPDHHFLDFGYCQARLFDVDRPTGIGTVVPIVKRYSCDGLTGCAPLTAAEQEQLMGAGNDGPPRLHFQMPGRVAFMDGGASPEHQVSGETAASPNKGEQPSPSSSQCPIQLRHGIREPVCASQAISPPPVPSPSSSGAAPM